MRKYISFFKMRFAAGLQYRMASFTALTTQVIWGLMECMAYKAIAESVESMPMSYNSVVTYIWLKEAFLMLFNTWAADNDLVGMIMDGGIAYEICRPVSVYSMWYSRIMGARVAEATLRCIPVLLCAFIMPKPYRMSLPVNASAAVLCTLTMFLGLLVTVSFCMMVYMLCLFTISPNGWRMVLVGACDFLSGNIIPLPFFPEKYLRIAKLFPFAYMQNVPFRIYCGDMQGQEIVYSIIGQLIWIIIMTTIGVLLWKKAERRIVVQGG